MWFGSRGILDETFEADRLVTTSLFANPGPLRGILQPDGKALVAGTARTALNVSLALAQYR